MSSTENVTFPMGANFSETTGIPMLKGIFANATAEKALGSARRKRRSNTAMAVPTGAAELATGFAMAG
jgi:hypothetical protein